MLYPSLVSSADELKQILNLQQLYLKGNKDKYEEIDQGFLTVHHSLDMLEQMHSLSPSVIIKEDERVIAYALVMTRECKELIPVLKPMFETFESIVYENKLLIQYKFYVMGQVCVDKDFRGKGVFEMLYRQHREAYSHLYNFIVTEISETNTRSMRAHEKIGFKTIHRHTDKTDQWNIVLWDWS